MVSKYDTHDLRFSFHVSTGSVENLEKYLELTLDQYVRYDLR